MIVFENEGDFMMPLCIALIFRVRVHGWIGFRFGRLSRWILIRLRGLCFGFVSCGHRMSLIRVRLVCLCSPKNGKLF